LGQAEHGMQTMNQSLSDLVQRGVIALEVAMKRSATPNELRTLLDEGKGLPQIKRMAQ
jgi:twitching motility protein PilT